MGTSVYQEIIDLQENKKTEDIILITDFKNFRGTITQMNKDLQSKLLGKDASSNVFSALN